MHTSSFEVGRPFCNNLVHSCSNQTFAIGMLNLCPNSVRMFLIIEQKIFTVSFAIIIYNGGKLAHKFFQRVVYLLQMP